MYYVECFPGGFSDPSPLFIHPTYPRMRAVVRNDLARFAKFWQLPRSVERDLYHTTFKEVWLLEFFRVIGDSI